jgi:hypothetical protein
LVEVGNEVGQPAEGFLANGAVLGGVLQQLERLLDG